MSALRCARSAFINERQRRAVDTKLWQLRRPVTRAGYKLSTNVTGLTLLSREVARYQVGDIEWKRATLESRTMDPSSSISPNKFKRYRDGYRMKGMKLVRIWTPDPAAPGFAREAARQAALLRGASEEADALTFIEHAADLDDWI